MVDSTFVKQPEAYEPWSSRRSWLIPGAALTAIFSWMFVVGLELQPGLSALGIVFVVVSYAAMIAAAVWIRARERRNATLAWLMATQATVAVVVLVLVLGIEAGRLIGIGAL